MTDKYDRCVHLLSICVPKQGDGHTPRLHIRAAAIKYFFFSFVFLNINV